MIIESNRLILQPVEKENAVSIFSYRSDVETNRYQGFQPKSVAEVEAFIAKVSEEFNIPSTWFQMLIIQKESREVMGDVGIHFMDEQQVELGCTLSKKYRGNGFASEAMTQVIDFFFAKFQKHRIVASVDPENFSSIALMKRLGFRQEAHFKQSIEMNGLWHDDMVFATLREEWIQSQK
ncbi:MAG: GNAT family N-acetyltransferase [Bacteroidetes bacterium]|nr:GNAT family N-acetyltransferase [Bacteroidota bacterium]